MKREIAYHFVLMTPAGSGVGPFGAMVQGFSRLSEAQAAAIKPRRIDIVTVQAGDTVQKLASRMAYADRREDRFRVLNALPSSATLRPGQKVKLVVFG